MTPAEEALRDAWLAEMWNVCRGVNKAPQGRRTHMCKLCGKPIRMARPSDARRICCHACRPAQRVA